MESVPDKTTVGLALAVIGMLVNSLVGLVKSRSESEVHSKMKSDVSELLRMHRDGQSLFSNVEVLSLLHEVKQDIAVMKERDG